MDIFSTKSNSPCNCLRKMVEMFEKLRKRGRCRVRHMNLRKNSEQINVISGLSKKYRKGLPQSLSLRKRPKDNTVEVADMVRLCVLMQRDVWRTTSWWFRFRPPWAVTVNSSSGRTMPNMNSSGTPWWVSRIPEMTFLWLLWLSTQPNTHTHTYTPTPAGAQTIFHPWYF